MAGRSDAGKGCARGDRLRLCPGCFRYAHEPREFITSVYTEPLEWAEVEPIMRRARKITYSLGMEDALAKSLINQGGARPRRSPAPASLRSMRTRAQTT